MNNPLEPTVILRWDHDEQSAHLLESKLTLAVLTVETHIPENTQVQIVGPGYRETGVVSACKPSEKGFIVEIRVTSAPEPNNSLTYRDPGVLSVETWLTEEDIDRILDEVDRELGPEPGFERCWLFLKALERRFGQIRPQVLIPALAEA